MSSVLSSAFCRVMLTCLRCDGDCNFGIGTDAADEKNSDTLASRGDPDIGERADMGERPDEGLI